MLLRQWSFMASEGPKFFEELARGHGFRLIAGLDEAGRGSLAGPVVAAAVILKEDFVAEGIADSKTLRPKERESAFARIVAEAVSVAVGVVGPREIEDLNILQATLKAMVKAVEGLYPKPEFLLIDGPIGLPIGFPQWAIRAGDKRSLSIAAASIVAKVYRDRIMEAFSITYPGYGFERHKGYGTKEHLKAIRIKGPCEIHRLSFRGVRDFREEKAGFRRRRACLRLFEEARV